ncbi:MAG: hypothetical protein IPO64_08920 [Bacteroidetes bacterium]|nr:hypothetical protein [Bacteroidota bacterium]MBL0287720.1 hypothetical protein [Bacteroidota bacterium]
MSYLLDEDETFSKENVGKLLYEANVFWQKKRLVYNVLVGIFGIICIVNFEIYSLFILNVFGVFLYGITANAFYSFGAVYDNWLILNSNGNKSLRRNRDLLFWVGTIFSVLLTIFCGGIYSIFL